MVIRTVKFFSASSSLSKCPPASKPEFAFIGRSNVGKSSLINMLAGNRKLAKISQTPGKTRTINHFLVNNEWFLVDLPGYGYSKMPYHERKKWLQETGNYILKRETLVSLFVLIDVRIEPQETDLRFMEMLGVNKVPFAMVFTKSDKISRERVKRNIEHYNRVMLEKWEELPPEFVSSAVTKAGKEEILNFIEESINNFKKSK
ncbi:MAG TPA: ribosome biogenesis GTP-binding protein YihA/YsxC [Bacteroidales bacterium]|nr:ribosome biogenesis GTP-binding protein YihA/YsxC [Bacteroidales bacterium]